MYLVLKLVVFHCYVSLPEGKICFGIWGSTVNLKLTGSNAWCCSQGCSISSWVAWILDIHRPKRSKRGLFFAPHFHVFSRIQEEWNRKHTKRCWICPTSIKHIKPNNTKNGVFSQSKIPCFFCPEKLRSAQFGAWKASKHQCQFLHSLWFWGILKSRRGEWKKIPEKMDSCRKLP